VVSAETTPPRVRAGLAARGPRGRAGIASLLSLVSGHESAAGVAKNQPAKLAAFEGLYETTPHAPLLLFGWVDEKTETAHGPAIPGLLSYLVHGDAANR
jgi:cytochrome d ubiquinol oxidase subunit I